MAASSEIKVCTVARWSSISEKTSTVAAVITSCARCKATAVAEKPASAIGGTTGGAHGRIRCDTSQNTFMPQAKSEINNCASPRGKNRPKSVDNSCAEKVIHIYWGACASL